MQLQRPYLREHSQRHYLREYEEEEERDPEVEIEKDISKVAPLIIHELQTEMKRFAKEIERTVHKKYSAEARKLATKYKEDFYKSEIEGKFIEHLEEVLEIHEQTVSAKFGGDRIRFTVSLDY